MHGKKLILRDRVASSPLSSLQQPRFILRAYVYDKYDAYEETEFAINVIDANEPPTIGFDMDTVPPTLENIRYVSETLPIDSAFGAPLHAYDPDVDQTLLYSFRSNFRAMLFINRCTGQLELLKSLDYESLSNFSVEVQVEDDHPYKLTATNIFHIRVMDINEPPSLITNHVFVNESTWSAKYYTIISQGGVTLVRNTWISCRC